MSAVTSCSWQPRVPPTMAAVVSVSPPKATACFVAVARLMASRRTYSTLATVVMASGAISAVDGVHAPLAACCSQHDAEMDSIRVAFMAKWGRVPVLELYRQMAIRQQKAKNFEQALWWAERGIAIYGTDCARVEAVEDLQKRPRPTEPSWIHNLSLPAPRAVRQTEPEVEILTCSSCGRAFQRTRLRGRKPLHGPQCRSQTA
jgi:hypothetical protein